MNDNDEPMPKSTAKWGLLLGVVIWGSGVYALTFAFWVGVLGVTFGALVFGVCFAYLDYHNLFVKNLPSVGRGRPPK